MINNRQTLNSVHEKINLSTSPPRRRSKRGLLTLVLLLLFFLFFTPFRTNILLIGIDRTPEGTAIGRSDTMVLTSLPPISPQVSLLSIPRDLWVSVPGYGENRINTAHYFAELETPGTGPRAARQVVATNFGVQVPYSIRLKFDGFVKIVDAMGGVTLDLAEPTAGLDAGKHTLDGTQALAFVRDRSGSDDFFRQQHAQLFITAALKNMASPAKWLRIPQILAALGDAVDTNVPIWVWPRLLYGTAFSAVVGFDSHAIGRDMVTPWTTSAGAQVLLPNWVLINPLIEEKFK
jgi:LCP family protein required for cell wall assembly